MSMMKMKRLIPVLLLSLMTLVSSTAVYAGQSGIQPFWDNVVDITVILNIQSGKAELTASVDGNPGVTKITATAVLERQNSNGTYSQVERWDNISADRQWLDWSATRYVEKGYTYRFTYTAVVYKNGVGETVSNSKSMYY